MIRTVIAAVFALVLVGCSSAPAAAPSTPTAATTISDAEYLSLVRAQPWVTPNMKDATLLQLGSTACALITESPADAQFTGWKRAVDATTANGVMTGYQAGGFLVYASARFCPDARDAYFPKS